MNLEQYIPFANKQFRPHQKEAIIKIIEAIEAGHKNIVLNACVGLGKSLIAYVLSQYFLEKKTIQNLYLYKYKISTRPIHQRLQKHTNRKRKSQLQLHNARRKKHL